MGGDIEHMVSARGRYGQGSHSDTSLWWNVDAVVSMSVHSRVYTQCLHNSLDGCGWLGVSSGDHIYWRIRGQYPISRPIRGQYLISWPIRGQYLVSWPIRGQYLLSWPIRGWQMRGCWPHGAPATRRLTPATPCPHQWLERGEHYLAQLILAHLDDYLEGRRIQSYAKNCIMSN